MKGGRRRVKGGRVGEGGGTAGAGQQVFCIQMEITHYSQHPILQTCMCCYLHYHNTNDSHQHVRDFESHFLSFLPNRWSLQAIVP